MVPILLVILWPLFWLLDISRHRCPVGSSWENMPLQPSVTGTMVGREDRNQLSKKDILSVTTLRVDLQQGNPEGLSFRLGVRCGPVAHVTAEKLLALTSREQISGPLPCPPAPVAALLVVTAHG